MTTKPTEKISVFRFFPHAAKLTDMDQLGPFVALFSENGHFNNPGETEGHRQIWA